MQNAHILSKDTLCVQGESKVLLRVAKMSMMPFTGKGHVLPSVESEKLFVTQN